MLLSRRERGHFKPKSVVVNKHLRKAAVYERKREVHYGKGGTNGMDVFL